MYEISVRASFASAHSLRGYEGVCENTHGHNWKVEVRVRTEQLDPIGIGVDFKYLEKTTNEILSTLDHQNINEIAPFDRLNPSSENIAKWLFDALKPALQGHAVTISRVTVKETDSFAASYFEET